jgi:hypothetical protein
MKKPTTCPQETAESGRPPPQVITSPEFSEQASKIITPEAIQAVPIKAKAYLVYGSTFFHKESSRNKGYRKKQPMAIYD